MKKWMAGCVAAMMLVGVTTVQAQDDDGDAMEERAAKRATEQVELTGKLSKADVEGKDKEGKAVTRTRYTLTAANGSMAVVPEARAPKKGGAAAYDLDALVGKDVKVAGQAVVRPGKKDTKRYVFQRDGLRVEAAR